MTLTYGQDYVSTTLEGVYPNHKDVERVKPAGGDLSMTSISVNGESNHSSYKTAEMLFKKTQTKLSEICQRQWSSISSGRPFTDKGSFQPNAFIPFTTLQLIYNKGDKLNNLIFMTQGLDTEEK